MPLDFTKPNARGSSDSSLSSPPRAPVSVRSRSTQIRLFILVFVVMAAVVAAESLFSGRLPFGFSTALESRTFKEVETRLPAKPKRSLEELAVVRAPAPTTGFTESTSKVDPGDEVSTDFWKRLYRSMSVKERDQLLAAIRFALRGAKSPLETAQRSELKTNLQNRADQHESRATQELNELKGIPAPRREAFSQALTVTMQRWREKSAPALIKAIDREVELSPPELEHLREVEIIWRDLALQDVRDDASSPSSDFVAWFALYDELQHHPSILDRAEQVSYANLFDQSAKFRGQPVIVSGEIKSADYEKARANAYGVTGYYVLWLRPENHPDAPIKIVSLHPPQGAGPRVDASSVANLVGQQCDLRGVFFKRMAYRAKDNIRAVPTILCADVALKVPNDSVKNANQSFTFGMLLMLGGIIAVVFIAIYLFSERRRPRQLPEKVALPTSFPAGSDK